MGGWFSINGAPNIILLGPANAGKSTLMRRLTRRSAPSTDVDIETCRVKGRMVRLYDISASFRSEHLYYELAHVVVFVVDAFELLHISDVRRRLRRCLTHALMKPDVPLLVIANDIEGSLGTTGLASLLHLNKIKRRPWHIVSLSIADDDLAPVCDWISSKIECL